MKWEFVTIFIGELLAEFSAAAQRLGDWARGWIAALREMPAQLLTEQGLWWGGRLLGVILVLVLFLYLRGRIGLAVSQTVRMLSRTSLLRRKLATMVRWAGFAQTVLPAMLTAAFVYAVLALSGTIAVAGGFALKDTATSFMARLLILTNKPFQVGDRVTFAGYYGEIREIGMRNVKMVTLNDNLVSIPTP